MLLELGVVEQRHEAVLEVLDGPPVTEVALRHGVTRQTARRWLRRYGEAGHCAGTTAHSGSGDGARTSSGGRRTAAVRIGRLLCSLW